MVEVGGVRQQRRNKTFTEENFDKLRQRIRAETKAHTAIQSFYLVTDVKHKGGGTAEADPA